MAKKNPKSPGKTASKKSKGADSKSDRKSLAELERKLVKLLQAYAERASQDPNAHVASLTSLRDAKRLEKLLVANAGPLESDCVAAIFRELASGISLATRPLRVAFLGPLHSYSHLATLERFGQSAELVAVRTIAAVFEEVSTAQVDHGVVPIENSTDGRIIDTLDRLTRASVKICGEVPLRIHHNLLGVGRREDVVEVCSKPQAISQCREWLANHLPHAKLTPTSSTTAAAERAAHDAGVGAIASYQAGVEYGLKVLARHIEDNRDNITRFAVIGSAPAKRTGDDKTSLMFELPHESGALASALTVFKRNALNLTWIESFPKPGSPHEYLFFVELLGYQTDLRVRRALAALQKKTVRMVVLGSYAQSAIV